MKSLFLPLFSLVIAGGALSADFAGAVSAALEKSATEQKFAVPGADPAWYFLANELKHLKIGDIGAADLATANVEGTDPLPAIVKYHDELKALGVEPREAP